MQEQTFNIRFHIAYDGNMDYEGLVKHLQKSLDILSDEYDFFSDGLVECVENEVLDYDFVVQRVNNYPRPETVEPNKDVGI
jgi:hypothetical protein